MALTYEQIREYTRDEVAQDLLRFLDNYGFKATSFHEGSVVLALIYLGAEIQSKQSTFVNYIKTQGFNGTAEGEALHRFSDSHYDNQVKPAIETQIRCEVTVAAGQGPHTVDEDEIIVTDYRGIAFRNRDGLGLTHPIVLSGSTTTPVLFQAEVAGTSGNVGDSTLDNLVTTFSGMTINNPPDTSVSPPTSLIRAGVDEESDPVLRTRNRTKWSRLSVEAVKDTLVNLALTIDAIKVADVADENPRGAGTADVYVAAEGAVVGGTPVSDLQTLLDDRFMGNDIVVGVTPDKRVKALAAAGVGLELTGTVYYNAAYQEADVRAAVEGTGGANPSDGSLDTFIKSIPLGGFSFPPGPTLTVPKNNIEAAIQNTKINGVNVIKTVVLTTPAGDLGVGAFQVVTEPPGGYSLTYVAVPVS